MLAKYDHDFDKLMMDLHEYNTQHIIMRNLIAHCTDVDFIEYLLGRMERFQAGCKAHDFFNMQYKQYCSMRNVQEAKDLFEDKYPLKRA